MRHRNQKWGDGFPTLATFAGRAHRQSHHGQKPADGRLDLGISAGLHEATEIDRRFARYTNKNLADYLMPVHADIGQIEVVLVPEDDRLVNPLGINGLGELGHVGMNTAVANAVFHATGVRVRHVPIRLEDLISGPSA